MKPDFRRYPFVALLATLVLSLSFGGTVLAQTTAEFDSAEKLNAAIDKSVDSAINFLKNRAQADDGRFSPASGIAVTSLCVQAILDHRPSEVNSPQVKKAIEAILSNVRGDGGIYSKGSLYRNYETSVAVSALVAANTEGQYESELKRAEAFLKQMQWDEGEGIESSDVAYGGAGYAKHGRPDLSNTSFMLDALRDLGNDENDEAIQKALRFVTRTQNLKGHGNDTDFAGKQGDGGFYYTPAAGGESKVVVEEDPENAAGLRSYGSMTYAGLKSMIYAGLTQDDPRVAAAMEFIQETYSLTDNPGMGKQGLYYYYHTFAKALDVADVKILTDAKGKNHLWNRELAATLFAAQQEDGSWVNQGHKRWMEGDRNLVTAYSLMALAHCRE
ncbi:MAG: prenyltransferase/squalene oxidase repeat-containing protein [Planctomycetota bacterium]